MSKIFVQKNTERRYRRYFFNNATNKVPLVLSNKVAAKVPSEHLKYRVPPLVASERKFYQLAIGIGKLLSL